MGAALEGSRMGFHLLLKEASDAFEDSLELWREETRTPRLWREHLAAAGHLN